MSWSVYMFEYHTWPVLYVPVYSVAGWLCIGKWFNVRRRSATNIAYINMCHNQAHIIILIFLVFVFVRCVRVLSKNLLIIIIIIIMRWHCMCAAGCFLKHGAHSLLFHFSQATLSVSRTNKINSLVSRGVDFLIKTCVRLWLLRSFFLFATAATKNLIQCIAAAFLF